MAKPKTIVGMVDEISKNIDKIPGGMTKDRFIEMKVQEEGITEGEGFDLLVMGRPEGPGCYCYVNSLLRDIIGRITKSYDFAVIDNAAGMEHISRRTERAVDRLVLVSDFSAFGVRSAKRIYTLARELGIKIGGSFLILNKVVGSTDILKDELKNSGLKIAGYLPYEEGLADLSISEKSVFTLKESEAKGRIGGIYNAIMKG